MVETLFVYALLLDVGLLSTLEYGEHLDELFMKTPDNNLLLELEWSFSDTRKSIIIILNHCKECSIDYDVFGCFLIQKLKEIYFEHKIDIKSFASKAYAIWQKLPKEIDLIEPFWTLSYVDDPLSCGDEQQTKYLFEKVFRFY